MISFAQPWFIMFLFLPLLVYFFLPKAQNEESDALRVPFINDLRNISAQSNSVSHFQKGKLKKIIQNFFLLSAWLCMVTALMRPQIIGEPLAIKNEGRDILLVVDISTSMNERDFVYQQRYYDRLSAVKFVVDKFIDERTEDRLGLVLFGTRAYLQVPLTYDKQALKEVLYNADAGMAGNSTSIGDAIGVALKNLVNDKAGEKVIILLTDGENNDGQLSLPEAIKLAKQEGIKVYTIGAGADERAFFGGFFSVPLSSSLDEAGLRALADETKGHYFRAKDVNSLLEIYKEINELEPSEKEARFVREVKELYYIPAFFTWLLFCLLLVVSILERRKK